MRLAALAFLALLLLPGAVFASDPGQPLDCSDWVFLEPGLSCTTVEPYGCDKAACEDGPLRQADNTGGLLFIRAEQVGTALCPGISGAEPIYRTSLLRYDETNEIVLGYVEDRCGVLYEIDFATTASVPWNGDPVGTSGPLVFDDKTGRLWIPMSSGCRRSGAGGPSPICTNYYGERASLWLLAVDGFATTFEILQTYEPTSGPIGFRVPYMPEGFPAADWFDTYYGNLGTVGDWSQAQPLECDFPASMPSVGDFLSVYDPLPSPSPGQGRYYVTAVSYQGQTRYGRKAMGGVLSGRDPAVLPTCSD